MHQLRLTARPTGGVTLAGVAVSMIAVAAVASFVRAHIGAHIVH